MCMEDIKLGRASVGSVTSFAVSELFSREIVGANKGRIALLFSNNGPSTITVYSDGTPRALGQGIVLPAAMPNLKVKLEDVGNLVCGRWFALATGAPSDLVVYETFLEREK